jgi:hypothetical protein
MPANTDKDVLDIAGQRHGQGYVTVWPPSLHQHLKPRIVDDLERAVTLRDPIDERNTAVTAWTPGPGNRTLFHLPDCRTPSRFL